MHKDQSGGHSGFTLVELLVVMSIILILVSIALPAANSARQKAKDTEVMAGCHEIQTALEQYKMDFHGYPGARWQQDSSNNWYAGPGIIGATPTTNFDTVQNQDVFQKDFYVPKDPSDPRAPYFLDGTPDPTVLDGLVVKGFMTDYPSNPFIRTTGKLKAQMANLFLFQPSLGNTVPVPSDSSTLDWNRYTADNESMRVAYDDVGRGHFTYVPLKPQYEAGGLDFEASWSGLSDAQASRYYNNCCMGYMLVGWGHSRLTDSQAKGISEKYWNNTLGWFDFDASGNTDELEQVLSDATNTGILYRETLDSNGSVGALGGGTPSGAPDIDPAFFGAVFFLIGSSTQ
jgi:prepilin-type N-terminal cleavage/methylation domain-containing protein